MDKSDDNMIYLDNNATTIMPTNVLKAMLEWSNRGNPSAGYASAQDARKMMHKFRTYLAKLCSFDINDQKTPKASQYKVIFVSCASEANATIIRSVVDSFSDISDVPPHLIVSAIEHKSVLEAVKSLETRGKVEVTYVQPTPTGHILPRDVGAAIRPNTCLVCIMHANNETGAINDVAEIGRIAHSKQVPFYTDTAQTFGKFPLNPIAANVDSFCVTFHKLHGPPGVAALIIKQQFLQGYKLQPLIFGSQNDHLRGGTENLPGIGAAYEALQLSMDGRSAKNNTISKIKTHIINEIGKQVPTKTYIEYLNTTARAPIEIIWLSGNNVYYLPGTILLSVIGKSKTKVCNIRMKTELEKRGIIVSIGSACNTSNPKASHVLYAMGADELIRRGTLRISVGDMNTMDDAKNFVREFIQVINGELHCKD